MIVLRTKKIATQMHGDIGQLYNVAEERKK